MVQIHRGLPSVRGQVNSKIGEALGMSLGQGLGEFTGQYNANKALESVLNDEELKKKPLSERWGALQTKLAPHGKFGQAALQQRIQIEQQAEQEKVQGVLAKYRVGKTLTEEEKASLPTKVQFDIDEMDLKKKEYEKKSADEAKKEKQRIQDIRAIGKERGISDTDIFQHINEGGSVEGAKAAWEKPASSYETAKDLGEGITAQVKDTIKKAGEYAPISTSLNEMKELSKKFSGAKAIAGINPFSDAWKNSANFEALSDTVLEPVFELYNPRGTLAQSKVSLLRSRLKPNWYDPQSVIDAKIAALQSLIDHKKAQADKYKKLIVQYKGNPPVTELIKAQGEDDDAIIQSINIDKIDNKKSDSDKGQPRADGKIKVRDKSTGKEGFIVPTEGWEGRFERV